MRTNKDALASNGDISNLKKKTSTVWRRIFLRLLFIFIFLRRFKNDSKCYGKLVPWGRLLHAYCCIKEIFFLIYTVKGNKKAQEYKVAKESAIFYSRSSALRQDSCMIAFM